MRFVKYLCTASILSAAVCLLASCNDDDANSLSEAVLASASSLSFEVTETAEKTITVYADGDWLSEVPEWVTISPESGTGTTDVTISVTQNLREGTPDNPRKAKLVFKGRTLSSRAEVLILQDGDKYRDVKEYTIGELLSLEDETVLSVPQAIVMAVTSKGFVASDTKQTGNIYVLNNSQTTAVAVGDKISFKGSIATDAQLLRLVDCDIMQVTGSGTATYPKAEDITDKIDNFNRKTRDYIAVTGVLSGTNITIEGAKYSASITDAPASMDLTALNGHIVNVKGYFAGLAEPVVKIMAAEIEDKGVVKVIYFAEDFEWLKPWAEAGDNNGKPAGQTVETNDPGAYAPQLPSPMVNGVSALDALLGKGYEFLRVTTKTEGECIYLQRNYLKFGKTSYQAGIILPKIENIPDKAKLTMSFDWSGMRQGSGKIDPVHLIIIVENDGNEMIYEIPELGWENDHKLEWVHAEVELTGATITKDTKVTIRQTEWPAATANRWFLDNIEIAKAP